MTKHARWIYGVIWLVAAAITVVLLNFYFSFVAEQVDDNSSSHLTEVYSQVDHNFDFFLNENWRNLQEWYETISGDTTDQAKQYITARKNAWGFSDFLFLNNHDTYMTIGGTFGTLQHGEDHVSLHQDRQNVMDNQMLPDGTQYTLLAIPVPQSVFEDFSYDAVGVTFTNEDMASSINTDAFGGQSTCFILKPDGTIVLTTQEGSSVFENYLSFLTAASDLTDEQIDVMEQDWAEGREGVIRCTLGETSYYLSYEPTVYKDYILLGVVPESAVSGGLHRIQEATIDVAAKVALVIGLALVLQIVLRYRKQARQNAIQLRNRDRMFSMLSANVDDVSLMIDRETGKVDYVSPNIERLMGFKAEDVMNGTADVASCIPEGERTLSREFLRTIKPGESVFNEVHIYNHATGELHWYHVSIYRDNTEGNDKYFMVMSDRTEDHRMAENLKNALDTANSANQAKSNFLSNMSHDIRTPMNAILGFTELMEINAEDPEKVHTYVKKITASGEHLLGLINDVLDMSKIESGNASLTNSEFRLTEMVDDINDIMSPQAKAKSQEFEIEVDDLVHDRLIGDKLRINQILLNLLSNAVKYTPDGGHIQFKIREVDNASANFASIQFDVIDDGVGMSPEYLETIFDPFTREEQSTTNTVQGTGLGMAITKTLVDLMGGIITIESEPGKGSQFTVMLTFGVAEGTQDESSQSEVEKPQGDELEGLHILMTEDNLMSAEMLKERLELENATVEHAANGQIAVDMFTAAEPGHFDLVLMDVEMPVMGGYDATRAIRSSDHPEAETITIFAMTANVFSEDVKQALDSGMNAHLAKPIDFDKLKLAVKKHLKKD